MDSRSNKARDDGATERLFDAISSLLEISLRHGIQATCDIHVSDRTGGVFERRRISARRNSSGEIVVMQKPSPCGSAPDTG
jgi:hypothetical protein